MLPGSDRNGEMGKGHSLSGHPDAVKPIVEGSLLQSMQGPKSIVISQVA
jgi:hypothetical protein